MDNRLTLKTSKEIINYLADAYPECFSKEGEAKPLKIGIFYDLVQRLGDDSGISKVRLRSALRAYTLSWRYLHGLKEGAERIDLDGNSCGMLSAEHAEHARLQLKEDKEKLKAKRQESRSKKTSISPVAKKTRTSSKKGIISETHCNREERKNVSSVQQMQPKPESLPDQCVDIATLRIGDEVNVLLTAVGTKPVKAIVVAIEKDKVRLETLTGLPLNAKLDNIIQ